MMVPLYFLHLQFGTTKSVTLILIAIPANKKRNLKPPTYKDLRDHAKKYFIFLAKYLMKYFLQ